MKLNAECIYVLCPAFVKTGGTELLHQLVYILNKYSINAKMAFYNEQLGKPILNPAFEKYVKEYIMKSEIIDSENNMLIVPELSVETLKNYKNIKKVIWWLSVDNFVKTNGIKGRLKVLGIKNTVKNILLGNISHPMPIVKSVQYHLCQSYYAKDFLIKNGIIETNIDYLSDYINDIYLNNFNFSNNQKEDIVLYNPKKGYRFTKKIIEKSQDVKWIPLQNLTNEEVCELMLKSKVYIDFGEHPGKDRFPREAAICGCCIITGLKGAAKFDEDLRINHKYKIKEKNSNIEKIITIIKDCLKNYDSNISNYGEYREYITSEKNVFEEDVVRIFSK